jgi:hypothetical protein
MAAQDDEILAPLLLRAQDALGAHPFAAALDAGRQLSYAQAMAEVRAWLTTQ